MNESNNAAGVAAALYNNKLYQYLTMPPSSLPRHPREEAELGANSLIILVYSDRLELQHKASCYRGHGYSNRLIFPAGVHWCVTLHARISRVAYTLLGCTPPKLSDTTKPIFQTQQRGLP